NTAGCIQQLDGDSGALHPAASDADRIGCNRGSDCGQGGSIPLDKRTAQKGQQERQGRKSGTGKTGKPASHTECTRSQGYDERKEPSVHRQDKGLQFRAKDKFIYNTDTWKDFPTQPPICVRDDGFSDMLDNITFS